MKRHLLPATMLAAILVLVLLVPASLFAASGSGTSGALLTITSNDAPPVVLKIYDSQIHTGTVQSPAGNGSCSAVGGSDDVLTDAYVLQGGSATGCDPGDPYETSQSTGTAYLSGGAYSFKITTNYLENVGDPICTSSGVVPQICAGPDTGFLTVQNTGNSNFTGTITLTGTALNPTEQSASYCPPGGVASDSFTGTLNAEDGPNSVTLALSTDSSNCGGFSQSLTLVLGKAPDPSATGTFQAGVDTWTISAALGNIGGEVVTFLPFPTNQNLFVPGPLFKGDTCNAVTDFSAPVDPNPVCVPFLLSFSGAADSSTFPYTLTTDCTGAAPCGPNDGGYSHFLVAEGAASPPANGYISNIFVSYDPCTSSCDPLPKKKGGGGVPSSVFAPSYANVGGEQNSSVSLKGYASNFLGVNNPPAFNTREEFVPFLLSWQEFSVTGMLVTNGGSLNGFKFFSGGLCSHNTLLVNCPANSLALQFVPADCTTFAPTGPAIRADALFGLVVFNPISNTFNVAAIPRLSFENTCQILQLVITGSQSGVQAANSVYVDFTEKDEPH